MQKLYIFYFNIFLYFFILTPLDKIRPKIFDSGALDCFMVGGTDLGHDTRLA